MAVVADRELDIAQYAHNVAQAAHAASRELACITGQKKNAWLKLAASYLRARTTEILAANSLDLAAAPDFGLNSAAIDRLRLTEARIDSLAKAVEDIIALPDPVGEVIDGQIRPNGLRVSRVRVPLGVVFFIYESRPNVTIDAAALCVKSGNAVILRGGKEALHSNQALYRVLRESLQAAEMPEDCIRMVETSDRAAVGEFLRLNRYINVTIPRGGKSLIERVMAEARMPVIKHYDGICHVYFDATAPYDMARDILMNSKCQRPGVCNAAECWLVHQDWAEKHLHRLGNELQNAGVELRGCQETARLLPGIRMATDEDYRTEYLDLILSVKVVSGTEAAIEHIAQYGSQHTDAIVTTDWSQSQRFLAAVDSAAVVVNASTRFNDGGELGLGAEIGISTDKIHARGPCGLREMTSYKYIVLGDGQVR